MRLTCRIKPYIQPFERLLALQELEALSRSTPEPIGADAEQSLSFIIRTREKAENLADRLAYWESVTGDEEYFTSQSLIEATTNVVRNGIPISDIPRNLPFRSTPLLPNRRCLRYGTHGVHEYRGKFFPQLVRALVNSVPVKRGGLILDPMCGSGTTVVESVSGGFSALGADINPLSVFMARCKTELLSVPPLRLAKSYERVRSTLLEGSAGASGELKYFSSLPLVDQSYLSGWFSEQVLRDLDRVVSTIQVEKDEFIRRFFMLALSNIIRSVSWQKLDDLRVRKEVRLDEDIDPVREFLEELGRSVRTVLAALHQRKGAEVGSFEIIEHSATDLVPRWNDYVGRVDAVVTSPPYATALPYLDTDRLSLSYLGLLSRSEHRGRDARMIGNREITERARRDHWIQFTEQRSALPQSIVSLVTQIDRLNSQADVGFRRKNLASLLGRYFLDMRSVLLGCKTLLRKSGHAFFVVGNNSTTAGGILVEIETAKLLADLAEHVGFTVESSVSMEMLTSRDIFRKNAMASEVILDLRIS